MDSIISPLFFHVPIQLLLDIKHTHTHHFPLPSSFFISFVLFLSHVLSFFLKYFHFFFCLFSGHFLLSPTLLFLYSIFVQHEKLLHIFFVVVSLFFPAEMFLHLNFFQCLLLLFHLVTTKKCFLMLFFVFSF